MADALVLGTSGETLAGSSPVLGTTSSRCKSGLRGAKHFFMEKKAHYTKMNKKVLLFFAIASVLIIVAAMISKIIAPSPITPTATPKLQSELQKSILRTSSGGLKYAQGNCKSNSDCNLAGCSSQICSSDPSIATTCELIADHPKDQNYSCGCIESKCAWYK